ncbi:MAG: LysM peptidoglycan-binding domain-containing protein [Planctomycetota bacterium]|nr:LysM peptidoglycan-binding domain-containing protein [Planctomycetota bacterium]
MRAALWIAVLLLAFVLAWRIQERWADGRREERDAAYARPSEAGAAVPEGFSRAVVGEPSGAAPITPPLAARPPNPTPRPGGKPGQDGAAPTGSDKLRHHIVQKGDSLSKICAAAYGTARRDVVEAVARANGLSNPEAVRIGQQIVLPPLSELRSPPR